jgi:cbb3-type cytochrome oxidase subunit 3
VIFFLAFVIIHSFFHSFVFCMQLVSKVFFFYSTDLRTRFARAANFPSREKSITLLICCINNYYLSLE